MRTVIGKEGEDCALRDVDEYYWTNGQLHPPDSDDQCYIYSAKYWEKIVTPVRLEPSKPFGWRTDHENAPEGADVLTVWGESLKYYHVAERRGDRWLLPSGYFVQSKPTHWREIDTPEST